MELTVWSVPASLPFNSGVSWVSTPGPLVQAIASCYPTNSVPSLPCHDLASCPNGPFSTSSVGLFLSWGCIVSWSLFLYTNCTCTHYVLQPCGKPLIRPYLRYFQWSCMDVRVGLWRKLSNEELMLLNCGVGEDFWESLRLQGDTTNPFWRSALGFLWREWC